MSRSTARSDGQAHASVALAPGRDQPCATRSRRLALLNAIARPRGTAHRVEKVLWSRNSRLVTGFRLASNPDSVGVIVDGPQLRRGVFYYQVFFSADKRDTLFPESALDAHEELENFTTAFGRAKFLDRTAFLQFLILEKIRKPLSDNLYTFYASRTDFQVHQFKPVLKFISSVDQRLFLADEVGLGKTIEAGIILTELQARHQGLTRVLVVCPAALLGKWEAELRRRFGEAFRVLRRPEFSAFLDRYGAIRRQREVESRR